MYNLSTIRQKLLELEPTSLILKDNSAAHAGHFDNYNQLVTHISIDIKSKIFENMTHTVAHRLIYKILADEISNGLHAISIKYSY